MDKITTTLAKIKAQSPCEDGYKKLVKSLGGIKKYGKDTPITFQQIYTSNGYNDTLWCLRATDEEFHYLWRHFAVDAAQSVEYLNNDQRVSACNAVMRRYADGNATEEERAAARDAARAAARDAAWAAARDAAWDAARAAQMRLLFDYFHDGKRPDNSTEVLKRYIAESNTAKGGE